MHAGTGAAMMAGHAGLRNRVVAQLSAHAAITVVRNEDKASGAGLDQRLLLDECGRHRRLSTVALGAAVVASSRPAKGLAAMRVRMSRAWRASSKRCV